MLINETNLDLVFNGFKTVYDDAYSNAPAHADKIAMTVSSVSREETYGWLGQFPQLRKWVGARHVHSLKAHKFSILNESFESTVSVPRNDIEDDRLGIFKPMFSEMGWLARQHPEQLIFNLLAKGFTTQCLDGQNFFSESHSLVDEKNKKIAVSNMQAGSDQAWFLLDTSRAIRPIVWQERRKYEFTKMDRKEDGPVFLNGENYYGVDARVNAGFGLWQLAFASKAPLTVENYAAARAAMMKFRSDGGRVLGINPTTLVVGPDMESDAMHVVNTEHKDGGGTNPWKGTAELIVTPFLTE